MTVAPLTIQVPNGTTLPKKEDKSDQGTDNSNLTALKEILDSSALTSILQKNLKGGESVSISADGKEVLTISKQSKSATQRIREFTSFAAEEASQIVRQDPAFAFKTSAMLAKEQVLSGLPDSIAPIADQAFLPTIRVVSLILDSKRLKEVLRSKRANSPDKMVSIGHVITDIVGVAGAGMMMIPGVAQVGSYLAVAGLMGDIGSFGYNIMRYFENKGEPVPDTSGGTVPASEQK